MLIELKWCDCLCGCDKDTLAADIFGKYLTRRAWEHMQFEHGCPHTYTEYVRGENK